MAAVLPNTSLLFSEPGLLRNSFSEYKKHIYSPQDVQNSMQSVINRFIAEGGTGHPDEYKWNLYSVLGIPEQSLLENKSMQDIVTILGQYSDGLNMDSLYTSVWSVRTPYLFMSDMRANILRIHLPDGGIMGRRHEFHVQDDGNIAPVNNLYKLHVCVKHSYLLYTLLKLNTLRLTWDETGKRPFQLKCLFNSRYSEISAENTSAFDIAGNGGSVPPIVVYSSENPEDIKFLFQKMNTLFSDEERALMGLMTPGDPTRIPPMNVRLNEMFAYALGDRDRKLTTYEQNIQTGQEPACRLPDWLLVAMDECQENPEITKQMRTWFGRPVCDRVVAGQFQTRQSDGTIDPLCYLSLSENNMIAPQQVVGSRRGGRMQRKKAQKTRRRRHRR